MNTLNTSIKHNTVIGAFISIWCFLFAFFSKPFEHGTMDTQKWIYVSVGYSFITFFIYLIVSYYQNIIYKKLLKWSAFLEISVYILFYSLFILVSYAYYRSSIIQGTYGFIQYLTSIVTNIILILTPLLFFIRWYALKLIPTKEDEITIIGDNKLDVLKIKQSDLVCISNEQNYVEIYFLDNNNLKSKLIRSSLKRIKANYDFLIQIHRSHLINPSHFISWKDSKTIFITQKELPVSKNYKNQLFKI